VITFAFYLKLRISRPRRLKEGYADIKYPQELVHIIKLEIVRCLEVFKKILGDFTYLAPNLILRTYICVIFFTLHQKSKLGTEFMISKKYCNMLKKESKLSVSQNWHIKLTYQIIEIVFLVICSACPFYAARNSVSTADIILLPYNYLLDGYARKQQNLDMTNAIIIFDEAHNLESMCTEAVSTSFTSVDLANCTEELRTCLELSHRSKETGSGSEGHDYKLLFDTFYSFTKEIRSLKLMNGSRTEPLNFLYALFERNQINWNTCDELIASMEKGLDLLIADAASLRKSKGGLSHMLRSMQTIFRPEFSPKTNQFMKYFKIHITDTPSVAPGKPVVRTINFWCFFSGVAMNDLRKQGVRSCILASGTLSPMDSFAQEMQLQFKHQLENPHVIEKHQFLVGVIPKGPRRVALSSAYAARGSSDYQMELGKTVEALANKIPQGCLGFFPSYASMTSTIKAWINSSVWGELGKFKTLCVEPQDRHEFPSVIQDYWDACGPKQSGGFLFGVCRGKISEGIDFSDEKGRGALILGIPYPNFRDPRVELKKQFLDDMKRTNHGKLSGDEWYFQQASRAVNQAIGRVIRHKSDYGVVLLVDERFRGNRVQSQLSKWVIPFLREFEEFPQAISSIVEFFSLNQAGRNPLAVTPLTSVTKPLNAIYASQSNVNNMAIATKRSFSEIEKCVFDKEKRPCVAPKFNSVMAKYASLRSNPVVTIVQNASGTQPMGVIERCANSTKKAQGGSNQFSYAVPQDVTLTKKAAPDPKEFKNLLKEHLKSDIELFQNFIRKFKEKQISANTMMHEVFKLFTPTKNRDLFQGFIAFLPKECKREWMMMQSSFCTFYLLKF
jgi:DNA repair helicase Rad3